MRRSAGRSAAPSARSRLAERRVRPRPAPPRSADHTQARASQQPTPRRAGPGRGRGSRREARGARHEAREPAGTRRGRAQTLERARPGRGAKAAGAERSVCFLFSLSFPARRRKTFIPGQFRFLGSAPGRRSTLLSSAQVVWPVSFLPPHRPQLARGQDRGADLEDLKVPFRFNILEF